MIRKYAARLLAAFVLTFSVGATQTLAASCKYYLTAAPGQPGYAKVAIVDNVFIIEFWRARPRTLYTIWTDHKNRATGDLAHDYPIDRGALARGVAPTFASTAGVTSGMGLDVNGVVTDKWGNATHRIILDHELLRKGDSPVVGESLAMQGLNRVGGGWLRIYEKRQVEKEASLQKTDSRTGLPLLERSTAQGITVVVHPDRVTHGHTPGVGGVDHFPAFNGDFPEWCRVADDDDHDDDEKETKAD